MTDIEQQARKEAEEKYLFPDDDHSSLDEDYTVIDMVLAEREAYAAALISERSKPSLMVGFSEEEIEQIVDDAFGDTESVIAFYAARRALRYANTRAVSIDRIMEVVKDATWINDVDLLRERLMKIMP